MKTTRVALSLIVAASICTSTVFAEETAAPAAPKTEQKGDQKPKKAAKKTGTYLGEVMEIDQKKDKLIVAPQNSAIAMVLNTSKVKKGMEQIKVGDWVEATFEAKVGTLYVLTVTKTKMPAPAQKKEAPKQKPANHP